jgi:FlaA1/EpsC-like NDP-sugar epimerase
MRKYIKNFSRVVFENRPWFITLCEAILVLCSLTFAWMLRFDFQLPYRSLLLNSLPILILIRLGVLRLFNLHRGWWHFSGITEALDILKAVGLGTLLFSLLMTCFGVTAFPRSVYIIEAVLTAGLFAGGRLMSCVLAVWMRESVRSSRKIILIGAGFAAQQVIREIAHIGNGLSVVGCVDDDSTKLHLKVQGVHVLGSVEQLPDLLIRNPADEALIAIPSATGKQMQRFALICQQAGIPFRTVPALREIIDGNVSVRQFREVRLEDLLGRDPVEMDLEPVRRELEGKVVLVTGAAGSIGSELCRQIRHYHPKCLVCVDQSETGLFYLQQEVTEGKEDPSSRFYVADISDEERMQILFRNETPQVIFHAAAYKHVPIMECNVQEAVKNNIFGLLSLLDVAERNAVESFVLISSDKAVNPTSVMGTTKRVCELILSCRNPRSMRCVSVRFGNVLGSNGSIIPVLQQQLQNNQTLTITHPDITRFFMTTREAVALVLQAFSIGEHHDILVLDMGAPIPIVQLARTLIQLSGKTQDQVGIRFTGLRPGEKLREELFFSFEEVLPTSRQKIKRVRGKAMAWPTLSRLLCELRASMTVDGASPVRAKLQEIVPEYRCQNGGSAIQKKNVSSQPFYRTASTAQDRWSSK